MSGGQLAVWRKAAAELAAQRRRQRWRTPRGIEAVQGAGMIRVPPESDQPATKDGPDTTTRKVAP